MDRSKPEGKKQFAAYMREWRRKKIAADPEWAVRERERNEAALRRRLEKDPEWLRRTTTARRHERWKENPSWRAAEAKRSTPWRRQKRAEDSVWHEANKASHRERQRVKRDKNGPQMRQSSRDYSSRKRIEALALFDSKCKRCGFDDPRALEIDHINGDGHLDSAQGYARWIKMLKLNTEHGIDWLRERFQVLCSNCHRIKSHEAGDWSRNRRKD